MRVRRGLNVCMSVSHNQGQGACRQFIPVGPTKYSCTWTLLSLHFPIMPPPSHLYTLLFSFHSFLPCLLLFLSSFSHLRNRFDFRCSGPFLSLCPFTLSSSAAEKKNYEKSNLPIATNLVCDKNSLCLQYSFRSPPPPPNLTKTFLLQVSRSVSLFLYLSPSSLSHTPP